MMRKTLFAVWFIPVFLLTLAAQNAMACCVDEDLDGYGVAFLNECTYPQRDCDDTNPDINPGVVEEAFGGDMCTDGVDNDCDTLTDMMDPGCFECTVPEDCDDGNPCTDDHCVENLCANLNNTEPCNDGDECTMDDVCANGECIGDPLDFDQDGYPSDQCGGLDCDDSDGAINPGATEAPFGDPVCTDQVDNDCDGLVDLQDNGCLECTVAGDCDDANPCTEDDCVANECVHVDNSDLDDDGYPSELCGGTDCNDSDPTVNPGVEEYNDAGNCWDKKDNDCDGFPDSADSNCSAGGCSMGATADASVYGGPSGEESSASHLLFALLLPVGAVVLLRRLLRKR
jgi:hypothetical protein